ncbi:unnamed protein product [Caenorhabditis bovis]|uniref:Uncharacterized protein n=1 Tax=Caenorhabditis bovis TaxID=2654633 RepID=A0A8S1EAP1_9PELO|nr:unnamed protein product [Caenorhabditis bovis]
MNQLQNDDMRIAQLRAIEAELLQSASHPPDPFVYFPKNLIRAATLSSEEWNIRNSAASGNFVDEQRSRPIRMSRRLHNQRNEPVSNHRSSDMPLRQHRSRPTPAHAVNPLFRDQNDENVQPVRSPERRRPLSPTQLPGVRAIPKEYNRVFRGLLTPGEYFAKSHTRYLGPFDEMPTVETLPSGDNYILLQRMGRLPDSGKSIFRQVGALHT